MPYNQLIILGNGFDLQCGLKSSFTDFMKTRKAKVDKIIATLQNSTVFRDTTITEHDGQIFHGNAFQYWLRKEKLTVWDFILDEDKQQRTWYDIEKCIRIWVDYRLVPENARQKPHIQQICSDFESNSAGKDLTPAHSIPAKDVVSVFACDFYNWDGKPDTLLNILLAELYRYEEEFAAYMSNQIKASPDYQTTATNLVLHLANDQMPQPVLKLNASMREFLENPRSTNILDFNYTDPLMEDWEHRPVVLNIHGLASEKNIIFGMDGTWLSPDRQCYVNMVRFTKTYRLMALSGVNHESLVQPYSPNSHGTSVIKFFGHSLGDADYSYFQAIFDEVNLYESDTHLIFYYNQHREGGENAQEDMFEKVNKLITTYGETLDNSDHGKNLLHKLLLEGRLVIKQAPLEPTNEYYVNL
ncbi:hypothetical protein KIM372_06000 [Bombiscardovia nodaiensis]|uniref:Bacteriophage abortive infection AbiH n=1 Tax=Bombiscardovia nodaiensis TaxID=2932181 RepID=A0ABN6SB42_9BIFI|nr:hypothetical protein KIM372_06000 [Bombiscardovia nodaiensis]